MEGAKKILVIRNDKLGDFMLAWPALSLLKKQYPNSIITALVPEYTAPLAKICDSIDNIIIDKQGSNFIGAIRLANILKQYEFDIVITLFSQFRTGLACYLSNIPARIAPATKIAQIFYNQTLKQKRSKSLKPEFEYNIDLIKYYIHLNNDIITEPPQPPFLSFDENVIQDLKIQYTNTYNITSDVIIIIIHPGSGGSAINLTLEQYADLAQNISKQINVFFIITAGPGEAEAAKQLSYLLPDINHRIHQSRDGIIEFCKFIGICDLFVSGSTGPLHIAGALNLHTAAFYPTKKSATSLRWQTLNQKEYRITFNLNNHSDTGKTQPNEMKSYAEKIISFMNET